MKLSSPRLPALGNRHGPAYALFLPEREPQVGVVILHGAGSAKESHFDFGRLCDDVGAAARADEAGVAALAYDADAHGGSDVAFGPSVRADALEMLQLMRDAAVRVGLGPSS